MGRGSRSPNSWRYSVMKQYRRRTSDFMDRASTVEEKLAWMEVMKWFDSILSHKKYDSEKGTIILPQIDIEKLNQVFKNRYIKERM